MSERDGFDAIGLFGDLTLPERERWTARCHVRKVAAGDLIIAADDHDNDVIFVLEGRVRVFQTTPQGREVTFAEVGPGGHVGELAAIDGGPRSAQVAAVGGGRVALMQGITFRQMLRECPGLASRLLLDFAAMIRLTDKRMTELCTSGAVARLAGELIARIDDSAPTAREAVIPDLPTQQALATAIGATRETVARTMAMFQQSDLVRRQGRRLIIKDLGRLRSLTGQARNFTNA